MDDDRLPDHLNEAVDINSDIAAGGASPPASAATGHSACCQRHFDPRGRGCAGVMAQLRTISRGVVDSTTAPRFRAEPACCVDTIQR